ncbi:MAG TPA: hypothetical protein VH144_01695 [Candidatus Saccharimonadales bacterium]|nr:hypothetical protein [Candidatus Saccharimonadales bacterium]
MNTKVARAVKVQPHFLEAACLIVRSHPQGGYVAVSQQDMNAMYVAQQLLEKNGYELADWDFREGRYYELTYVDKFSPDDDIVLTYLTYPGGIRPRLIRVYQATDGWQPLSAKNSVMSTTCRDAKRIENQRWLPIFPPPPPPAD